MLAAGTPIGSPEFVMAHLEERFSGAFRLLERLRTVVDLRMPRNIPSKHGLFHIARLTVQALINFTLRTVCSSVTLPFVQRLNDAYQKKFLCFIDRSDLGVAAALPAANARELFGLRLFIANRHGGMGIIDSVKAGPSALLGCLRQSAAFAQAHVGGILDSAVAILEYLPELPRAITVFQGQGGW